MPVTVKTESTEDQQNQQKESQEKEAALTDALLAPLDLPKEIDEQGDEVKTKIDPKKAIEEVKKDDQAEEAEEAEETEEADEGEEEDEEVIPKSKFQKRLDAEVARRKVLEAKLAEMETGPKVDSRTAKLEAMSERELKAMKVQARDKWFDAKQEGNPELAVQYQQLEDEIDGIIKTAPKKFEEAQAKAYNDAANEVMSDPLNEDIDFEKSAADIKKLATDIYNKYGELKSLKTGQATALKMAVDHYRETQKFSKGKSRVKELKQKNNKLKRQTSLDSSAIKGDSGKVSLKAKYDRAKKTGMFQDKLDYATQIIDVDRYLPPDKR